MLSPYEIVAWTTYGINQFFSLILLVLSVLAFVEALRASAPAFISSGRRTKGFWLGVTGASLAYSVIAVMNPGFNSLMIQLIVAVAVGVFLTDVRPVVSLRR